MKSNLYIIIRREFLERVTRKSFILTTILMPILMVGLMLIPSLVMIMTGPESKNISVIDHSGVIASQLHGDKELTFTIVDDPSITLDSIRTDKASDAILIIGNDVVQNPKNVQLYTQGAPSIQTEEFISNQIEKAIENIRIKQYEIDNLEEILANLNVNVTMSTYRLDTVEAEATSSIVSYLIGIAMAFMLYMFLIIYGQMVMNSIIEEKNNRVLEIIVSSVKPTTLMLGKILGIALVALTQILIWAVLVISFSRWLMPVITSGIQTEDLDLLTAINQLGDTGYVTMIFVYIMIFLMLGYLFYSGIFAAIGSSVDNVQDASQLTTIPMIPIMLGIIFSTTAVADPNSALAFWLSIIPFTSPMVMMARIPFGIPSWEIWLAIVILVLSVLFVVWLAAKIYRVGIFMYGKKPTFKDLIRWTRYK